MKILHVVLSILMIAIPLFSMEIVINNPEPGLTQQLADQGYDVIGRLEKGLTLIVNDEEYQYFSEKYDVTITDTDEAFAKRIAAVKRTDKGRKIAQYPTYEEFVAEIQQLEQDYPKLCQISEVGKSRGQIYFEEGNYAYSAYNQSLWMIKISDNVTEDEDEPGYMIFGEHHAREPSSLHVSMYMLRWLLENYETDSEAKAIVDSSQIWFMPLVNPNGYTIVIMEDNGMMRKNIRDNYGDGKVDITEYYPAGNTTDGVDLNRNFSVQWGTTGISFTPNKATYCGPEALSEPEVATVARMLDSLPHILAEISYHSYAQSVLYSPAHNSNAQLTNSEALIDLGAKIASNTKKADGSWGTYTHGTPGQILDYNASGGLMDYAYIEKGIFGYCAELGWQFVMTQNLDLMAENNLEGAKEMFNRHTYATITGTVTTSAGEAVPANITIKEVDKPTENRYTTDSTYGRYFRFLSPGSYTVTVTPMDNQFEPRTFEDIEVSDDEQTELNVTYITTSIENNLDITNDVTVHFHPNHEVEFSINRELGSGTLELYSVMGQTIRKKQFSENTKTIGIDLSTISPGMYFYSLKGEDFNITKSLILR